MLRRINEKLVELERKSRKKFRGDLTDPQDRLRAIRYTKWADHGVLRNLWHNFSKIAPQVYRANHPDHDRFAAYAEQGIKSVINLRGANNTPPFALEQESCDKLGLNLISIAMSARQAPTVSQLMALFDAFQVAPKPFLIHCKSGADRTGLAGALYLMIHEGQSVEAARRQLSFRYLHIKRTSTGVLDHFLDTYSERNARSPIDVITWIKTEYDRDALIASFAAKQASLKPWQGWT